MQLLVLPETFAICRLTPDQNIPQWALMHKNLLSITYTAEELSIVCLANAVPAEVQCEKGWKALKVQGPLAFTLTGVLASLTTPLAAGKIPLFALSTFDTDYLLLKQHHLPRAKQILEQYGHMVAIF
jgi:hypothetical protein